MTKINASTMTELATNLVYDSGSYWSPEFFWNELKRSVEYSGLKIQDSYLKKFYEISKERLTNKNIGDVGKFFVPIQDSELKETNLKLLIKFPIDLSGATFSAKLMKKFVEMEGHSVEVLA